MKFLKKLNGKAHYLISSVCISKDGSMIWSHTDRAILTMKNMKEEELKNYLSKISDAALYAYNVYQLRVRAEDCFLKSKEVEDTIMGFTNSKDKGYLRNYK